jgi:hypothetical protein
MSTFFFVLHLDVIAYPAACDRQVFAGGASRSLPTKSPTGPA